MKMFKLSSQLYLLNFQVDHSLKKFLNTRIAKAGKLKLDRMLDSVQEKIKDFELELNKKTNVKKSISNALDIMQGEDIFRRREEILNKTYLESISEIILNHQNFAKIPRLNINNIEVNHKLTHVKIFWNFTENDTNKIEEYTQILNEMKPEIQMNLRQNYYRNSPPEITFFYDLSDGVNNQMEFFFESVKKETSESENEAFDPRKLFAKEKLIKKEFHIKSLIQRDPKIDFPTNEKNPTKFYYPHDMNLFMYNLDFKRIYEYILVQISQGKSKRRLGKSKIVDETLLSPYITPPIFKESDLKTETDFRMPLTDDRIQLMKKFVIANKKKVQRQSRELKKKSFEKLDEDLDKNLDAKQRMDEKYKAEEDNSNFEFTESH